MIGKIVEYSGSQTKSTVIPAMGTLSNIALNNILVIDEILNCGVLNHIVTALPIFPYLFSCSHILLRSISTGTKQQCEMIIHHPKLLDCAMKTIDIKLN